MIAFIQPFGLHAAGGGSRILRGLLSAAHPPVLSINTGPSAMPPYPGIEEIHMPLRPSFGWLDRSRLHGALGIFDEVFRFRFEDRLRRALLKHNVKLIHIIPHSFDIVPVIRVGSELRIPCVLNIHDDIEYTTLGHPLSAKITATMGNAWRNAKGIVVISNEIGKEYSHRYGEREYRIVTDGIDHVAEAPSARPAKKLRLYFMGLFHLSYRPNLRSLLDALQIVRDQYPDWEISVTCRSGMISCSTAAEDVPVKVLPFASEAIVANDMLSADLLYLPLPFQQHAVTFGKFSMSTKLVTYLGSGLPILYHGPQDAAACKLLTLHDAAVICTTLDAGTIASQIVESASKRESTVDHALTLARSQFMLADQQSRFWGTIAEAL